MGIIRQAQEQLDILKASLDILQTITKVITDPEAINRATKEFIDSMAMCDAEIKSHEDALNDIEYAKEKMAELTSYKEQVEKELNERTSAHEEKFSSLSALQKDCAEKQQQINDNHLSFLTTKKELEEKDEAMKKREAAIVARENAQSQAVADLNAKISLFDKKQTDLSVRKEAVSLRESTIANAEKKLREI